MPVVEYPSVLVFLKLSLLQLFAYFDIQVENSFSKVLSYKKTPALQVC